MQTNSSTSFAVKRSRETRQWLEGTRSPERADPKMRGTEVCLCRVRRKGQRCRKEKLIEYMNLCLIIVDFLMNLIQSRMTRRLFPNT